MEEEAPSIEDFVYLIVFILLVYFVMKYTFKLLAMLYYKSTNSVSYGTAWSYAGKKTLFWLLWNILSIVFPFLSFGGDDRGSDSTNFGGGSFGGGAGGSW